MMNKRCTTLLCLAFFIAGCQTSWQQPVPNAEIVYQTKSKEIAFINANGTNQVSIKLDEDLVKPVWSSDGKILFGFYGKSVDGGYPAYWDLQAGTFGMCSGGYWYKEIAGTDNPNNPFEVYLENAMTITLYDLKTCSPIKNLVDYSNHPGKGALEGLSYFSATQELLYGLVKASDDDAWSLGVMKLDLKSGQQIQLAEGVNPAWSPDGKRVAYLGLDGLYVMQNDGALSRRLVQLDNQFSNVGPGGFDPSPRWSPNGEWLVYHRCVDNCYYDNTPIIKISANGGPEEIITTGGLFPSWHP